MTKRVSPKEIALLSWLPTLGIPLDGEAVETLRANEYGLLVEQTGGRGGTDNCVVELDRGGTAGVVSIGIENSPGAVMTIAEYRLELPWTELSWLEEPSKKLYGYRMPASQLLHPYAREKVLNHRVGSRGSLLPRGLLEGWLLGTSKEPIPMEYAHQQGLRTQVWVFDTRGNGYKCDTTLCVMRCEPAQKIKAVERNSQSVARVAKYC